MIRSPGSCNMCNATRGPKLSPAELISHLGWQLLSCDAKSHVKSQVFGVSNIFQPLELPIWNPSLEISDSNMELTLDFASLFKSIFNACSFLSTKRRVSYLSSKCIRTWVGGWPLLTNLILYFCFSSGGCSYCFPVVF